MKKEDNRKYKKKPVVLIGYSGHAYVVCDILKENNYEIYGYCELEEKKYNPFGLQYMGSERDCEELLVSGDVDVFVAVGSNEMRKSITQYLEEIGSNNINVIHDKAIVSPSLEIGSGALIGANTIINACSRIGNGVICNSGSIIEHECILNDYVHLAPGAVLCGNVEVGENTFIGARSVVKQGVKIGKDVIIGAGSVVIKDIPDGIKIVGNPQRQI